MDLHQESIFQISSVDIGICREESTGRQKDISDLTYGGSANYKSIEQILDKKHASVVGKFGCKGYDTFGPFKLVGGIAKDHPNEEDMKKQRTCKRITLIFEKRKTGDFTPRFSGVVLQSST